MAESQKAAAVKAEEAPKEDEKLTCGLVMPISGTEDGCYSPQHWKAVRGILGEAVQSAGFAPRMVSDSDPTAIIQRNIVNNLYYDPIVVCDVSSKNPNVMFELGLRLAFDKPVVIVKDEITDYTFDIGIIQHVKYPCQLDYYAILDFIVELTEKIKATYLETKKDSNEYGFLRHFGGVKAGRLREKDSNELLLKLWDTVEKIYNMNIRNDNIYIPKPNPKVYRIQDFVNFTPSDCVAYLTDEFRKYSPNKNGSKEKGNNEGDKKSNKGEE